MFRLTSDIRIGPYRITGVHEVEVRSSWDELTDTCTLKFPRRADWLGKNLASGAAPLLKRNDPVSVRLGYDGANVEVFQGYISKLTTEIPVVIECQDTAYLLKQQTVTKAYKEAELSTLLKDILPSQVPFQAPAVRLGQFRITNATPAKVLAYLKDNYVLKSWFRAGKLYTGLAYVPELQRTHVLRFERNVVDHSLEYLRKEDVKIKLKAISMKPDNTKLEYETGDDEGEQRTLYFYDVSEADLRKLAEEEIERLRYEGYRGSLTTFLAPHVNHGDVVDLRSAAYPERDGRYYVKAVTTTFGMGGGRQTIELDAKL
jgi:hypothetical protein